MGRSEEGTDFWGNKVTTHYDDDGNKVGSSQTHEPGFFESLSRGSTESYEKHYDTSGNETGSTQTHDPGFFESVSRGSTESYEKHYDTSGNETGSTQTHDPGFFESVSRGSTESYDKHYDADGSETGWTERHEPGFFESLARGSTKSYRKHYDKRGKSHDAGEFAKTYSNGAMGRQTSATGSASSGGYSSAGSSGGGVGGKLILAAIAIFFVGSWMFGGSDSEPTATAPQKSQEEIALERQARLEAKKATMEAYSFGNWSVGTSRTFSDVSPFTFCTRPCNYSASQGVQIKLAAITKIGHDTVRFDFVATAGPKRELMPGGFKNKYNSDFLLFVFEDSYSQITFTKKSLYGEPPHLLDAAGRKYKALNGIEGLQLVRFNSSAVQANLPFGTTSRFHISFPIPNTTTDALHFVSPSLSGHQSRWFWTLYDYTR